MNSRLFALTAVSLSLSPAALAGTTYRITDLGLIDGAQASTATAINNSGVVAGFWQGSATNSTGFRYTPGVGSESLLPISPNGINGTYANAINASGMIAGFRLRTVPSTFENFYDAGYWNPTGSFVPIATGGGYHDAFATDVDDAGRIVGTARNDVDSDHAFIWSAGTGMTFLSSGADEFAVANALNESGTVAGYGYTIGASGYQSHALVWKNGVAQDIGALSGGGNSMQARAINASGTVVGLSGGESDRHPFLWTETEGMSDLGLPDGFVFGDATGINAGGAVVGIAFREDFSRGGFVWTKADGMRDLSGLIDPATPGWEIGGVNAINDAGQIVGTGTVNGEGHAFLATPVPEPASMAALCLGFLALHRRRPKR